MTRSPRTEQEPDRLELAEERTDWAQDRTVLANERTFAAWLRTGLASLAVALGLQALFRNMEPTWAAKAVATVFVVAAVAIFLGAAREALRTARRLDHNDIRPLPRNRFVLLTGLLSVAAVAAGAILWLL